MSEEKPIDPTTPRLEFLALLGLTPPVSVEDVKQAYLEKAKTAHPDHGGDTQDFVRLQDAFQQATEYARFKAGRMEWLSRWVEQYAEQQHVVDEIRALGGDAEVEPVDAVAQSIGPDFANVLDRIISLRLEGPKIDDAVIEHLARERLALASLRSLELKNTRVTSAGLNHLHECHNLRHLDLSGTPVHQEDLEVLVFRLERLKSLVLTDTGITWWGRKKLGFGHKGLTIS